MVNFSVEQIREIMYDPNRIRNMSVIAHVDHGKSTLTDSLIAKAGIIAMKTAGDERYMDTRQDEKDRGITIKSTGVSLYFECLLEKDQPKVGHLFNLIDSPGHVDFSSEVTAALRVTDGALVVVDAVEGVAVQTETVLRQAMQEKIKPVLFINKVDRNILELEVDGESMYNSFVKTIDNVNVIISTYESEDMGDMELHPAKGNVAFGSGKDCWAFTLKVMGEIYAKVLNCEVKQLMERFWGDNFYDAANKMWRFEGTTKDGKQLKRAFAQFIMDPIIQIARAAMQNDYEKLKKMLTKLNIIMDTAEWELRDKHLNKCIMQKWINAADAIMEMMIIHLPSPAKAQKYRYMYLYEGPKDDPVAIGIRDCDVEAPLCMYVSKMVPTSDKGRFYAYGRVFSGKVSTGLKVIMMGPNHVPGKKNDRYVGNIQRTVLMMGRKTEFLQDIPCGNLAALVGVDKYLSKTGTITTYEEAHNIRVMKYSVSPVVRVSVSPKNPSDLPKLVEGMIRLAKSDPLVLCINNEQTGENIIAGSGELHVEICINDLEETFAGIPLIRNDPIVTYCETVSEKSSQQGMSKSANKHNRLYCTAEPLNEELALEMENGTINLKMEPKDLIKEMGKYGYHKDEVNKIWCFGVRLFSNRANNFIARGRWSKSFH
jgi:elongation factor 2